MSTKKQRLSAKDFRSTLDKMRHWPKQYLDTIALVVWDANYWRHQCEVLEKEIHSLREQDLLERRLNPVEEKKTYESIFEKKKSISREERAYQVLTTGSKTAIELFCKAHQIFYDDAKMLANNFARQNGLEEI